MMYYPQCQDIHFSAQEVIPQSRVGGTSYGTSCWNNNTNENNDNSMDYLHTGISWEKAAFEGVGDMRMYIADFGLQNAVLILKVPFENRHESEIQNCVSSLTLSY